MKATVEWSGVTASQREFLRLPAELSAGAEAIVLAAGHGAVFEILSVYPTFTGNLRRGVSMVDIGRGTRPAVEVRSTAPHVFIYEKGTKPRYTKTHAYRGIMPKANVFRPAVRRARDRVNSQLPALLERYGLTARRVA